MSVVRKYLVNMVRFPVLFSLCGGDFSGSVIETLDDPCSGELGYVNSSDGISPCVLFLLSLACHSLVFYAVSSQGKVTGHLS